LDLLENFWVENEFLNLKTERIGLFERHFKWTLCVINFHIKHKHFLNLQLYHQMSSTQKNTLQRFVLRTINGGTLNLELTTVLRESKEMKREMHKRFQLLLKYFVFLSHFFSLSSSTFLSCFIFCINVCVLLYVSLPFFSIITLQTFTSPMVQPIFICLPNKLCLL